MGNGDIHPWTTGQEQVMHSISSSLRTIAGAMEAQEMRAREKPQVDPNSLGAKALWMQEVAGGDCLLGFSDWVAWHESESYTTPEDMENVGRAVQAINRGFADMEAQVKGKSDDTSG